MEVSGETQAAPLCWALQETQFREPSRRARAT